MDCLRKVTSRVGCFSGASPILTRNKMLVATGVFIALSGLVLAASWVAPRSFVGKMRLVGGVGISGGSVALGVLLRPVVSNILRPAKSVASTHTAAPSSEDTSITPTTGPFKLNAKALTTRGFYLVAQTMTPYSDIGGTEKTGWLVFQNNGSATQISFLDTIDNQAVTNSSVFQEETTGLQGALPIRLSVATGSYHLEFQDLPTDSAWQSYATTIPDFSNKLARVQQNIRKHLEEK